MSNDELKKKIVDIVAPYVSAYGDDEAIADDLIAAGIGDVKGLRAELRDKIDYIHEQDEIIQHYRHRAEVAERALRNAAPRLNCRGGWGKGFCKVDECEYYHCNNDKGCIKAHLEQAEKELAAE